MTLVIGMTGKILNILLSREKLYKNLPKSKEKSSKMQSVRRRKRRSQRRRKVQLLETK
jgi:hypothetical protein